MLAVLFRSFGFIALKTLIYMSFQSSDFERTWWRLFQKRVVRTKFDIYVFITKHFHIIFKTNFVENIDIWNQTYLYKVFVNLSQYYYVQFLT